MTKVRIVYKHWTKDKELVVEGLLPKELNNASNDRFVVQLEDGTYEDVLKDTVKVMTEIHLRD